MNLEELRSLDPNDPSSWPMPVKLAGIALVAVGLLAAGWYFVIQDELTQLDVVEKKEKELRTTFLEKKAEAINLPAYKQQMEEMQLTFGSLLRQLPDSAEVPDLLIDITQAGLGRGLEFQLFKPKKEKRADFYAELPIDIKVRGDYHELGLFVSDVAALPRIVTFGDIKIKLTKGKLTMSAVAKTYRYLNPDEIEAAKPKKKKRRGRRR